VGALDGLRICWFGRYDPAYSRNRILAKCARREGATTIDLAEPGPLAVRWPRLLGRALRARFDLMVVGFRGHTDVLLAAAIARARRVPLVFDPLVSRYDERVVDRAIVAQGSALARWYFFTDRAACRLADRVLVDTDTHLAHFVETFGVPRGKFRRVWLGADDEVIGRKPQCSDRREPFTVFFYGRFGPVHGVDHIVRAAHELERRGEAMRFVLVGKGQTYQAVRALAAELGVTNVRFVDPLPYHELGARMAEADLCLGIFGTTARAGWVIPNKVFDALAAGRALVTADTPAVREALVHGEHAWLCAAGDGRALADAIAALRRDVALRVRLAESGYQVFRARFSLAALSREVGAIFAELVAAS
jgi:glycosyltransferase involved in cell wall biosynthesis